MKLVREHLWNIALGVLALFVVANYFLSNRPLSFYSMVQVDEIATVPYAPELAHLRGDAAYGAGFIPHLRPGSTQRDLASEPLKVGWMYKEGGFLSMPYFAEEVSTGPAVYIDTGSGYSMAGIDPADVALIEQKIGRPVISEYRFGWYWHVWGWLYPPLLILVLWMWRKVRRVREEREEREWASADVETGA